MNWRLIIGGLGNEISEVLFSFNKIQRTNEPITLEATPVNVNITDSRWEIRTKSGDLVGLSFDLTASIPVTTVGYYDVFFKCKNGVDQYVRKWEDIFVWYPKFTEAEADIVINLNTGGYSNNFASANNSGLKIYVKGTGDYAIYMARLFGSAGYSNYVRIQKEIGNTPTQQNRQFQIEGGRYIMIDGYNDEGTRGWTINAPSGTPHVFSLMAGEPYTNVHMMGMNIYRSSYLSSDASSVRFNAIANSSFNASNWVMNDMAIFDCNIENSTTEAIYVAFTNDQPQGGFTPTKTRNMVIAWNRIYNAGQDGIQPCSSVNIRVHDNTIENWGVYPNEFHEKAISWNHGNSGRCYNNYAINGKMAFDATSGLNPYDIEAGQTTPGKLSVYNNVFIEGTAPTTGVTEPYFMYFQVTNGGSGNTSEWPIEVFNNTIVCNKVSAAFGFSTGGWSSPNFKMFNNIIVRTGDAGDFPEIDWLYDGTYPTNPTINNLLRTFASYSDIGFDANYRVPSLSSPAYSGASNTASLISGIDLNDKDGLPLLGASSYAHGAYSGYNFKTITPAVDDAAAATFTVAPAMGSINDNGGTLSFTANKPGLLYYVVVANDAAAPSISTILEGNAIFSNGSASSSGLVTGLSPATAYDLYCVFKTRDFVVQSASTKVDFTTTSDVVAPTLSGWEITNAQPGRIYFNSSEVITGTTYSGFTIADILGTAKTVTGIVINTGQTTGHYLTVSSDFDAIDYLATIAYSGSGSNIQDASANALAAFSATAITNNITATRIQINVTSFASLMGSGWNNADLEGSVAVRTLISNLNNLAGSATGYSFAITEAWHSTNNGVNGGTGLYIPSTANVRGIELYSDSGTSKEGTFRIAGLTSGKKFDIVYTTKGTFNTPSGNVAINGASGVSFGGAYTEHKQTGTVNGSGHIDIVATQTTNNASVCITAIIVMIYP